MSIEQSVYTQQPAMSGSQLRELAGRRGLALRFLDPAGMPQGSDARQDEPLSDQSYVLIGWSADDDETADAVDGALQGGNKSEIERLGTAGKLGWCSIDCGEFDAAEYEEVLRDGFEQDASGHKEPMPAETLERMQSARTVYSLRCGTRPRQCGDLLGKVADLIRDATDGFDDQYAEPALRSNVGSARDIRTGGSIRRPYFGTDRISPSVAQALPK